MRAVACAIVALMLGACSTVKTVPVVTTVKIPVEVPCEAPAVDKPVFAVDTLALDAYFVYPEELKSVARIQVFRDFLVANAQRWHF